jgi:hypothetical protein
MGMVVETEHTCQWYHRYVKCQRIARKTEVACEQCGRNDDHKAAVALAVGDVHREFAGLVVKLLAP